MKFTVLCLILILEAVFAFQAYAFQDGNQSVGIDLETIDAVEAIAIANAWKWSRTDVTTSVTAREVVFKFSDGTEKKIPLPEDEMMVAVAPYIRQTHKWKTHFMSSCQGELAGKSFYVTAVDQEGNLLYSGTVTTLKNGFFELWFPRNRMIDLNIQGLNRAVHGKVTTFDTSKTCVTTFRLR